MNCPECDGVLQVHTDGRVGELKPRVTVIGNFSQSRRIVTMERVERAARFAACTECEFSHEF